jgi:hypothetical protein
MSPRGWGARSKVAVLSSLAAALAFSEPVAANPVAPPFIGAFDIAVINFSINGFLMMGLYVLLITFGRRPVVAMGVNHYVLLLALTVMITALGAMIDMLVRFGEGTPVKVVGAALVGCTTVLLCRHFLRTDRKESAIVFAGFFLINFVAWSLFGDYEIYFMESGVCAVIAVTSVLYLVTLALLTRELGRRYSGVDPDEDDRAVKIPADKDVEALAYVLVVLAVFLAFSNIYWA